jgi:cobalt-zinc-cadmium efflux system protein
MSWSQKMLLILAINVVLMLLEVSGGIISGSLALISDAGHVLTDSVSILLSYLAFKWSAKPATERRTFGYHRLEIIVALVNGISLIGLSGYILYEAAHRFFSPQPIQTGILLVIAVIGLLGNFAGLLMLHKESGKNLNIRGSFLHILGDTISSVGVIAGGVIILFTGWTAVDALISVVIAGIMLRSAVSLTFESGEILLEAVPRDIDVAELEKEVRKVQGVRDIHDVHIWTITSGRHALSAHLLIENISTRESQRIIQDVRGMLEKRFNITHSTLEAECDECGDNACEFTKNGKGEGKI